MTRFLGVLLLLIITSTFAFSDDRASAEVKDVIQRFHDALDRHDVAAIGALASSDVIVFENGHRNDGWVDFRDNHLVPEFKEPAKPSHWEFVKVVATSGMAWGYTKEVIDVAGKDGKHARLLVWSVYVLQKTGTAWKVVVLDWSIRRLEPAEPS